MKEFEAYAKNVTAGLDLPEATRIRIFEEVMAHLEDETRRCMDQKMPRPEAEGVAMERFGQEQIISQLVAQALERRQARFRLSRNVKAVTAAVLCVIVSLAVGAWFTIFKDAVAGQAFMEHLPGMIGPILYLGGFVGCLALLGMTVAAIFRVRKSLAMASFIVVALIFYISMSVFQAIPALHETIGTVREGESEYTRIVHSFCLRLYLCWVPTLVTGTVITILVRRRAYLLLLAATLTAGLLSALLSGFNSMIYKAPWMYWMKWPKLLSAGLLALVFVILTGFLARAIAERFRWGPKQTPLLPPARTSAENDSVETVRTA